MSTHALPSLFRGVYHRVARRLGVDPSYVSRVARRERRSEAVSAALKREVERILNASETVLAQSVSAQMELALTFCEWARKARARGRRDGYAACARQAADSAFRFLTRLKLEPGEFVELNNRAEQLKRELRRVDQELLAARENGRPARHTENRTNGR